MGGDGSAGGQEVCTDLCGYSLSRLQCQGFRTVGVFNQNLGLSSKALVCSQQSKLKTAVTTQLNLAEGSRHNRCNTLMLSQSVWQRLQCWVPPLLCRLCCAPYRVLPSYILYLHKQFVVCRPFLCRLCCAPYGGPIASIRDERQMVVVTGGTIRPVVRIFSAAGGLITGLPRLITGPSSLLGIVTRYRNYSIKAFCLSQCTKR